MQRRDYMTAYVEDLPPSSTSTRSARPACASASTRWAARASPTGQAIAERHRLDLEIVNDQIDPTFRFVPLDWDGKTAWTAPPPTRWPG